MDWARAVALFKVAVELPLEVGQYPAQQKAIEENRLLMLRHINSVEADEKYLAAICKFSKSQFEDVRTVFAKCVPEHQVTHEAVDALKNLVLTETDTVVLASAVPKLMEIHGMEFDSKSSIYKSIYSRSAQTILRKRLLESIDWNSISYLITFDFTNKDSWLFQSSDSVTQLRMAAR